MRETKIESFPDKNLGKRLNVWELKQICKKREVMGGRAGGKVCATGALEKTGPWRTLQGWLSPRGYTRCWQHPCPIWAQPEGDCAE